MSLDKKILLVEDDDIDAIAIDRIFAKFEIQVKLQRAKDGLEALSILSNPDQDLVLLDLNMPKMNGIEFLEVVRNKQELRNTPVLVVTTSDKPSDIKRCEELNVAGYFLKEQLNQPENFIQTVQHFLSC